MDLKQVEYIVKIADEHSITRAAEQLFLTQSALNQQLLHLEKELGTKLFYRGKTDCVPTPAGEIYLRGAREILTIRHRTYNEISDLLEDQKSHISVGFTPNRGIEMFIDVYPQFHAKYPGIFVEPKELSVRKQQMEIAHDRLDIGFMTLSEEQKTRDHYITLGKEELYLVVPENHPKAAQARPWQETIAECALEDFRDDSFVMLYKESTSRTIVDGLFRKAGIVPKVLFDTSSNGAILAMVQSGQCCGVVPAYYLKKHPKGVCCFAFDSHPTWEVAACYKKDAYLSKAAKSFIELARDYWGFGPEKTNDYQT